MILPAARVCTIYAANSCKSLSLILLITSAATAANAAAARFAGVAALLLLLAVVIAVAACIHMLFSVHTLCELVSVTASSFAIAAVLKPVLSAHHIHVVLLNIFKNMR
jgi:hypothetical protein